MIQYGAGLMSLKFNRINYKKFLKKKKKNSKKKKKIPLTIEKQLKQDDIHNDGIHKHNPLKRV